MIEYVASPNSNTTRLKHPLPTTNKGLDLKQKFLYQFTNDQFRECVLAESPDRLAWTRTTKVEIYSQSLKQWQMGTVVEVKGDLVTVTYGPPSQQMKKTIAKLKIN